MNTDQPAFLCVKKVRLEIVAFVRRFEPLSKDLIIVPPPLTFRTPYQILPHTNSYFHCLYSYLDFRLGDLCTVPVSNCSHAQTTLG